jgi:branched-chain amino acid transport system substrate-binding protein
MTFASLARRVAFAAGLLAAAAQAQDIKLAYNGDLSASPTAQSGRAAVLGIQAAIDDINSAGGVLGRKLALVTRDDLAQPQKSIQNMVELIDNEKVVAVLGPPTSATRWHGSASPTRRK